MLDVDFGSLLTCIELSEADIAFAASTPSAMRSLLARFEQIAAPDEGASIILAVLARLATTACDWIDGDLRIEIVAVGERTRIRISSTIGGGFAEKVLPDTNLNVPIDELGRAVAIGPKLIAPLVVREQGERLVLVASTEIRRTSLPPPMITIDPSSLLDPLRALAPLAAVRPLRGTNTEREVPALALRTPPGALEVPALALRPKAPLAPEPPARREGSVVLRARKKT